MSLFLFPTVRTSSACPTPILSFNSISPFPKRKVISAEIPARDRVIDFGKYKGKMLGTLPSKYLTWVSKNLRAQDFEQWAKLADEVLRDPVYKDRLEWESAERILNGDDSRASRTETPVSDLVEIAERFGWDSEDKAAWKKVDFGLLGTSKGCRIPRIGGSDDGRRSNRGDSKSGLLKKDSGVLEMGNVRSATKEWRSRGETKLGFRGLDSERERKFNMSIKDSVVSRIGAGSNVEKDLRLKSGRNLGSSDGEYPFQREGRVGFLGKECRTSEAKREDSFECRNVGFLSSGSRFYDIKEEDFKDEIVRGRRAERRERQILRRNLQMQRLKREVGVKEDGIDESGIQKQTQRVSFNPFPGREALLRRIHKQKER